MADISSAPPVEPIGIRLRRLRVERGLSQRELAAPGVSYAYISRIEAGTRQPSVKALRRLSAKLGVSTAYLETGSELEPSAALELKLTDLELAVRLGDSDGVEEQVEAVLGEAPQRLDGRLTRPGLDARDVRVRDTGRSQLALGQTALEPQPLEALADCLPVGPR